MKSKTKCLTVGLTGGIASGKSAVSKFFEELDCTVIDADIEARIVVEPKSNGLNQLVEVFGKSILTDTQNLDRSKLRKIVFNNSEKLIALNAILHPLIQQSILDKIELVKTSYCIIVIPLLCESSSYNWLDRVLVVDVKPETQLARLLKRDSITIELAKKMMQSQCDREQRLSIADDVINNEQSLQELENNVQSLHRLYKNL